MNSPCEMCEQYRDDVNCYPTEDDDAVMLCTTCVAELREMTERTEMAGTFPPTPENVEEPK